MKQLKFMLAAATAIGLATASQAAEQTTKLVDNENFDSATVGAAATTLMGYSYAGATAADNESVVKAGGYNGSANALQVNTGTDPLLRALSQLQGSAQALDLASYKSVYIDTMVQFTVTPAGDTVEKDDADKLMIYLQETNVVSIVDEVETTTVQTNLMVKAAAYTPASTRPIAPATFAETDVAVSGVSVVPGAWYRLVVTSTMHADGFPQFQIQLAAAGQELVTLTNDAGLIAGNATLFPSLQGLYDATSNPNATTLTYVGFAGEGLVDNLTVATVKEVTTVDFTIAWNADGFSAVTYTINGGSALTPENGVKFTINPGDDIVITPVLADWYKRTDSSALTYTDVAANQSVTFAASKTADVDSDGNVTVTENTTATDLGIAAGSAFADANTTVLGNLMTWAIAATKGGATTAAGAATLVNSMTFDDNDNPTSEAAEAYLLDCAVNSEAIAAKKAAFKFPAFTPGSVPAIDANFKHNGTVTVKGSTAVDGEWGAADAANHNFFKAVLTK